MYNKPERNDSERERLIHNIAFFFFCIKCLEGSTTTARRVLAEYFLDHYSPNSANDLMMFVEMLHKRQIIVVDNAVYRRQDKAELKYKIEWK
jgi:hypothetical protein